MKGSSYLIGAIASGVVAYYALGFGKPKVTVSHVSDTVKKIIVGDRVYTVILLPLGMYNVTLETDPKVNTTFTKTSIISANGTAGEIARTNDDIAAMPKDLFP